MNLSIVINTKNSAKTLEKTLKSVADIADEVVLVDMESIDDTLKIAKKHLPAGKAGKAKIFKHKDVGYVEPARNFAISKAKGDWIFILDSDEELSSELKQKIKLIINDEVGEALKADCYYIPRKNLIFGKWIEHTGWWPDYQLRFFKKGHAEWLDEIHSFPITQGVVKQMPAKEELAMIHHNYDSVNEFISRLNRYTDIQSKEESLSRAESRERKDNILELFTQDFLSRFFAERGIEDGVHGLSLSLLQAMYGAVTQMKVAFDQKQDIIFNKQESIKHLRKFQKDLNYWIADYHTLHSRGPKRVYWQIRRKFKI